MQQYSIKGEPIIGAVFIEKVETGIPPGLEGSQGPNACNPPPMYSIHPYRAPYANDTIGWLRIMTRKDRMKTRGRRYVNTDDQPARICDQYGYDFKEYGLKPGHIYKNLGDEKPKRFKHPKRPHYYI